jgi:predicted metalloprotease with PDZ domain
VHFGTVTRGGGASALMLIASDAGRDALLHDWVAVHEFSHLLLPFLRRQDAWLSEGIATYYQEVLRVRAGVEPEGDAWRRLYEGASLGRESVQTLAEESAAMMQTHAFKRIYWAGAAFALLTDAELRRTTEGRLTLDALLRDLAPTVTSQSRPWAARDLLAQLDGLAATTLFSRAMQRWVDGPTLPDLTELYARLGIRVRDGAVDFDPTAPDAWLRSAIMSPPAKRNLEQASVAQPQP